jgi:hypothetical protein
MDFGYLLKEYRETKESETIELQRLWSKIFDEYIAEFGLAESFIDYMRNIKHLAIMKLEQIIEFDSVRDAEITILEVELDQLKATQDTSFGDIVSFIEKYYGFMIDPDKTPVATFYNRLNYIKKNGSKSN